MRIHLGALPALLRGAGICALLGCAAPRHSLLNQGTISYALAPSSQADISAVAIESDGEHLLVSGRLHHRNPQAVHTHEHVEVSLLSADGTLLKKVGAVCTRHRIARRKWGACRFSAQLPLSPPPGAKVRIEYHPSAGISPAERL